MNEYTAEDFKNAKLAIRGTVGAARRAEPGTTLPWIYGDNEWEDDKGMAEHGWRPVREHNPHATDALEEEIQDLRGRIGELIDINAGLRDDLNARIEFVPTPLTLDTLREAWESAEVLAKGSTTREGDVVIERSNDHNFGVFEATKSLVGISVGVRILRRAPQPGPWQALADVLRAAHSGGWFENPLEFDKAARHLHNSGVRVTGGDDS